jgi:pimeloyl-ACP methyl ester carboxylesterase
MKLEIVKREPKGQGKSTSLIFLHGAWHGAWCWEEHFLDYFAGQGFCSIAFSLRGHGRSESKSDLRWTRLEEYVEDLLSVTQSLESPPVIIAHSMGGYILLKYLEKYTAKAAVIAAPVPPRYIWKVLGRLALERPLTTLKAFSSLSLLPLIGSEELCKKSFFSEDLNQDKLKLYFSKMQDASFRSFMDVLFFAVPPKRKLPIPAVIFGAEKDGFFGPEIISHLARDYQTDFDILPQVAHDFMLEDNWELAAGRILGWIMRQHFMQEIVKQSVPVAGLHYPG